MCTPKWRSSAYPKSFFSSSYPLFLVLRRRDERVNPSPGAKEFAQKTGREQPLTLGVWLSWSVFCGPSAPQQWVKLTAAECLSLGAAALSTKRICQGKETPWMYRIEVLHSEKPRSGFEHLGPLQFCRHTRRHMNWELVSWETEILTALYGLRKCWT